MGEEGRQSQIAGQGAADKRTQDTKASSAVRLRMTSVEPSSRISCFFLRSLSKRLTVSRDAPVICAISSWVSPDRTRISSVLFPEGGVHESSSFASFPAEEPARIKSWI